VQLPIVLDRAPAPRLTWLRRRPPTDVKRQPAVESIDAPTHPLQDPALLWWSDAQLW
jgi:hypothetical protein